MISVAEAIQIVIDETKTLPVEQVQLAQALHRVLAQDIVADLDMPPFDRAQMDGYAVRSEDVVAVPSKRVPVTNGDAQVILHARAENLLVPVVVAERALPTLPAPALNKASL